MILLTRLLIYSSIFFFLCDSGYDLETAFFVIRENVNHGEGLLCSHIQCQKKGIRFVYCKVCKAPVARVNFSTRHRHSIRDVHAQEGDVLPYEHSCLEFAVPIESDPSYTSTPLFIPPQNTTGALPSSSSTSTPGVVKLSTGVHPLARLESPNEELHTEKGERFADKYKFISRRCQKKRQRKSRGRRSSSDPLQGDGIVHATVAQDIVIKGITISTEEKGWIELLRKRPETTDQIGMKNWLVEVISCTEPDGRA